MLLLAIRSAWPCGLQVRQTIQEDFGRPVEQLYAQFGAEPIASAR